MTESTQELASRWQRLWGALLDTLITTVPLAWIVNDLVYKQMTSEQITPEHITPEWFLGMWRQQTQFTLEQKILLFLLYVGVFWAINGYLLAKHGQTVGKKIAGTRIVDSESGRLVPLSRVFWLRYLPISLVGQIPHGVSFLCSIDILFIFRRDKRCIHDLIAGTKVVKVNEKNAVAVSSTVAAGTPVVVTGSMKTTKLPEKEDSTAMNDDAFYDEVAKELESNNLISGVWTRAFAEADGDENRARAIYIKLRVAKLLDDYEQKRQSEIEEAKRMAMPSFADPKAVSREVVNERWVRNTYANGDVTMSDKDTGRMWLYNANPCGKKKWVAATAYCNNLTYAGYSDWCLPDVDTLEAQFSQKGFFAGVQSGNYWSSTSNSRNTDFAWCVDMDNFRVDYDQTVGNGYVWPMRGGQ